jgi:hypothetical protein
VALRRLVRALDGGEECLPCRAAAVEDRLIDISAFEDASSVSAKIWTFCCLVADAAMHGPIRWAAFVHSFAAENGRQGSSPIDLLITAEIAAKELLARLGPAKLLDDLAQARQADRIAAGTYAHQHYITIRYMEAVVAFLRRPLRPRVRDFGFQYLFEEFGHEAHEREACRSLGIADGELDQFVPLPYFAIYPDLLVHLADTDPVAFCLCISVAEGLPGTGKPIAAGLAKIGLSGEALDAHGEIDRRLDHASITRRLFSLLPFISPLEAKASIANFLFVLEISQRAWAQLANYAEDRNLPRLPRLFGMSVAAAVAVLKRE